MSMQIEIANSFAQIEPTEWNALTDGSPVLNHHLFSAMEATGCIGADSGWQPYPIVVKEEGRVVGVSPLFLKSHSYGEYVFDWSWADAYERNGIPYYPKLLTAIPFTPVSGSRLMSTKPEIRLLMSQVIVQQMQEHGLSSAHILFTDDLDSELLRQQGWLERAGVQFRWQNEKFADFDDFLSRLAHDKRKKIHQERRKITEAGIMVRRLQGMEISEADWDFFYICYRNTYHQHHSSPYLNRDFFTEIGHRLKDHILLIIAERNGQPIATAFNFYDAHSLFGRYWGAIEYIPGLHFELCYYQAQEFCIAQGIQYFEGGAQGEHKLARGFLPRATHSFHQIAHPEFDRAIRDFVSREAGQMEIYHHELEERAPFKKLEI